MSSKELNTISPAYANLKAYYRFESGALTTDSSGNSHTLTDISDPAEDASGKFGGAVALDGNDAYSATGHADLKPTGNYTVGVWVKTSTTGATQAIFQSYSQNTNIAGIFLYISTANVIQFYSGKNTGTVENTDWARKITTGTVTDGNWHFIVGTWDGSYLRVYIDGVQDGAAVSWANAPVYAATNYVRIGTRCNAGTNASFITGSLDDVWLLNGTALSAEEVKGLYIGWKKYNGASNVDIKTINGLATGSIKTFNGI